MVIEQVLFSFLHTPNRSHNFSLSTARITISYSRSLVLQRTIWRDARSLAIEMENSILLFTSVHFSPEAMQFIEVLIIPFYFLLFIYSQIDFDAQRAAASFRFESISSTCTFTRNWIFIPRQPANNPSSVGGCRKNVSTTRELSTNHRLQRSLSHRTHASSSSGFPDTQLTTKCFYFLDTLDESQSVQSLLLPSLPLRLIASHTCAMDK